MSACSGCSRAILTPSGQWAGCRLYGAIAQATSCDRLKSGQPTRRSESEQERLDQDRERKSINRAWSRGLYDDL
jgi:hypothetical protein